MLKVGNDLSFLSYLNIYLYILAYVFKEENKNDKLYIDVSHRG